MKFGVVNLKKAYNLYIKASIKLINKLGKVLKVTKAGIPDKLLHEEASSIWKVYLAQGEAAAKALLRYTMWIPWKEKVHRSLMQEGAMGELHDTATHDADNHNEANGTDLRSEVVTNLMRQDGRESLQVAKGNEGPAK